MTAFYVVYEHDESKGGIYGTRFSVPYVNRSSYLSSSKEGLNVIAEDLTQDEAINYTSLTPEICRLFAVTEKVEFTDGPILPNDPVRKAFAKARDQINADRNLIKCNDLVRVDASKYIATFKKMVADIPLTVKSASQASLLIMCYSEFGQVKP